MLKRNEQEIEQTLRAELRRLPQTYLTPAQRDAVAKAAVPFFRLGNYQEAIDKGTEQVLFSTYPRK